MSANLKEEKIEAVLKNADTHLTTVGDLRGIMSIFVKCTLNITQKLDDTSSIIKNFNASTTKSNNKIFWLNVILTVATILGAIATLKISGIIR